MPRERKEPNANLMDHFSHWRPCFPQSATEAAQAELEEQLKATMAGCCVALEQGHIYSRSLHSFMGAGPSSSTMATAREMLGTGHTRPVGCSITAPGQSKLLEKHQNSCMTAGWRDQSGSSAHPISRLPAGFPGTAMSNTACQPGARQAGWHQSACCHCSGMRCWSIPLQARTRE